jgi:hypothetical protein
MSKIQIIISIWKTPNVAALSRRSKTKTESRWRIYQGFRTSSFSKLFTSATERKMEFNVPTRKVL